MSDNSRKSNRAPVVLKIKFKSENLDQFIQRYSVDVSHGGIFIRTKKPLQVGQVLRFEFQLKDSSPLIMGQGTVIWTREPDSSRPDVAPGMGVRFDKLEGDSRKTIERVLSEKAGASDERFDSSAAASSNEFGDVSTKVAPEDLVSQLANEEDSSSGTPLPAPTPFKSDAGDFSQETFEESTRVADVGALGLSELGQGAEAFSHADSEAKPESSLSHDEPEPAFTKTPDDDSKKSKIKELSENQTSGRKQPATTPPPPPAGDDSESRQRPKAATAPPPQQQSKSEKKSSSLLPIIALIAAAAGAGYLFLQNNESTNSTDKVIETPTQSSTTAISKTPEHKAVSKIPFEIQTTPAGAMVELVGTNQKSSSPFSLQLDPDSKPTLRISRPGYQSQELVLDSAQSEKTLNIPLKAKSTKLTVTSTPRGAQVFIDGRRQPGRTPLTIQLKTVPDEAIKILLKKNSFDEFETSLSLDDYRDSEEAWTATVDHVLVNQAKAAAKTTPAVNQQPPAVETSPAKQLDAPAPVNGSQTTPAPSEPTPTTPDSPVPANAPSANAAEPPVQQTVTEAVPSTP